SWRCCTRCGRSRFMRLSSFVDKYPGCDPSGTPNMPTDAQDALPVVPESLGRPVHWLLGLPFDALTLEQAVARIAEAVKQRTPLFLSTPNLNFLIASQHNAEFQRSVLNSDLSVA